MSKNKEDTYEIEKDPDEVIDFNNIGKFYPAKKNMSYSWCKNWRIYCYELVKRDNFKRGHLRTLEILCDLLEEYETLSKFVKENGYSFESKFGLKAYPEVELRNKCLSNIISYCKLLDIKLAKDKANGIEKAKNEWEEDI